MGDELAGRVVPRVYRASRKAPVHELLEKALSSSGARVLFKSSHTRTPTYVAVELVDGQRIGLLLYLFRITRVVTGGRATDESRGQLRFGGEQSWLDDNHHIAKDVAGIDTTLLLGVDVEREFFVGLDPELYDPMPLGISAVYMKDHLVDAVAAQGWVVWQHENDPGERRSAPRTQGGVETVVAFQPNRLLQYARFQRQAVDLGLDQALRFSSAQTALGRDPSQAADWSLHQLEQDFGLTAHEILEIIVGRNRLAVAVRGGVAEAHLGRQLEAEPTIETVTRLDKDGQPDFALVMQSGQHLRVECKNASPHPYADGSYRVEVQKTRGSKRDKNSRFYLPEQFEVLAACLYSPTGSWTFRFRRTAFLTPHPTAHGRIAPNQRIDDRWHDTLPAALMEELHVAPLVGDPGLADSSSD